MLQLSSGRRCSLIRPTVPLVPCYYVLLPEGAEQPTMEELDEMWALAHRLARWLARHHHGDPECFTLLFSGARTRKRGWPHIHIIPARSPAEKRWLLLLLSIKRLTRLWERRR
jgi:hypothetical protein